MISSGRSFTVFPQLLTRSVSQSFQVVHARSRPARYEPGLEDESPDPGSGSTLARRLDLPSRLLLDLRENRQPASSSDSSRAVIRSTVSRRSSRAINRSNSAPDCLDLARAPLLRPRAAGSCENSGSSSPTRSERISAFPLRVELRVAQDRAQLRRSPRRARTKSDSASFTFAQPSSVLRRYRRGRRRRCGAKSTISRSPAPAKPGPPLFVSSVEPTLHLSSSAGEVEGADRFPDQSRSLRVRLRPATFAVPRASARRLRRGSAGARGGSPPRSRLPRLL